MRWIPVSSYDVPQPVVVTYPVPVHQLTKLEPFQTSTFIAGPPIPVGEITVGSEYGAPVGGVAEQAT
jgi:hypothetical protein